jgi:hypothetical protein
MMNRFQTLLSVSTCAVTTRLNQTALFELLHSEAGAYTRPLFSST